MAKTQASYVEKGFGQVEPNHLSAQVTGQIYAQLPAASAIEILENGQYVKYDYAKGVCDFEGAGEWMLVFNEVKVYKDRETDADFAMIKDNYGAKVYDAVGTAMPTGTTMVPRVFKTNIGDIYTTNTVKGTTETVIVGAKLTPNATNGILEVTEGQEGMLWEVVKVYTMPDGQHGVKIMRIQ